MHVDKFKLLKTVHACLTHIKFYEGLSARLGQLVLASENDRFYAVSLLVSKILQQVAQRVTSDLIIGQVQLLDFMARMQ